MNWPKLVHFLSIIEYFLDAEFLRVVDLEFIDFGFAYWFLDIGSNKMSILFSSHYLLVYKVRPYFFNSIFINHISLRNINLVNLILMFIISIHVANLNIFYLYFVKFGKGFAVMKKVLFGIVAIPDCFWLDIRLLIKSALLRLLFLATIWFQNSRILMHTKVSFQEFIPAIEAILAFYV